MLKLEITKIGYCFATTFQIFLGLKTKISGKDSNLENFVPPTKNKPIVFASTF